MIRKILLIALFIHCLIGEIFPQSTAMPTKGIENILSQSKEIALQPYFTDTILAKRIDSLTHATHSDQQFFEIIFQTGLSLCNTNHREEASKYLSYCLSVIKDIYPKIPQNSLVTYIHIMNQIGFVYNCMGLPDLAMNYYSKALDFSQENNCKEEEAILCNNIASILQAQKKYSESDSLFKKAIVINEEFKNPQKLFVNYNNLSVNYAKRENYTKALEYAFLAMHQLDAVNDSDMVILIQRNIGSIYLKQKETRLALQILKQVEKYQIKHHQEYYLAGTYQIMHNIYKAMDRKELAIEYLKKALALSEEHNNIMDKTTLLIELSDCYAKEKQYHTAFAMLKQSTVLKDSIYKIDEEKRTKSLSTAYNEERALQEKLIQIENVHDVTMQKIYIITACVIIILLLIAGWINYRLSKTKKKTKKTLYHYVQQKRGQMERQEEKIISLLNEQEKLKLELEQNERKQIYYSLQDTKNKEFIAQLTDRLKQQQNATPTADDQMALLEKSYELAAKYMNGQDGQRGQIAQIPTAGQNGGGIGTPAIPVQAIRETTVSGLQQPMSDADFIRAYSQPRNYGFNTAVGTGYAMGKNTVAACIHQDQTLTDGQAVKLRLLEPMQAGNIVVPKNTLVAGTAKVQGERLDILVSSIEYAGNIIPVELAVFDTDGQKGLSVPSSMEQEAFNEAMANIGSGLGTSISFARSAGQQVAMDVTRGLLQGTSGYLAKKFRTVKVKLKAGYKVMLYAKQQ